MGKKDAVSKHYMSKNEILRMRLISISLMARSKVKPEDLEELDSSELVLPYGKVQSKRARREIACKGRASCPHLYRNIVTF